VFFGIFWGVFDVCVIWISELMKFVVVEVIVSFVEYFIVGEIVFSVFDECVVIVVLFVVVGVVCWEGFVCV